MKSGLQHILLLAAILFYVAPSDLRAQATLEDTEVDEIRQIVTQHHVEFDIRFLAADEFLGRDTGTNELDIASRYIATTFELLGVSFAPDHDSYFQNVPFERFPAPEIAEFHIADSTFVLRDHLLVINSARTDVDAPIIFLEHATRSEIEQHGVEGKIVVAQAGLPGQGSPQQFFSAAPEKQQWVEEAGGLGLIELYTNVQFPWQVLTGFLGGERISLKESDEDANENSSIPHLWMNATHTNVSSYLEENDRQSASIRLSGEAPSTFYSRNVVGLIEGTDSELKSEHILLGAHYDHIGVSDNHPEPITSEYIYNGARDNAVGTSGVLNAARYFAENPPRRPVILAAWTAEEIGLLGSSYFANNPMIPLDEIVYKINIDGAGYNDTTKVTVIGLGRTEADDEMKAAASAFGLEAIADPVPEQNLFDRSDNVSFARQGIPAPTYSMGLTDFDDEINYYYHQTTDGPDTVNYRYVTDYIRSFVMAARLIADLDDAPFWVPGDVYEVAGKELYGKE